jgi:inactive STAND
MNDIIIQPHVVLAFTPAPTLTQLASERKTVQRAIMGNGCLPFLSDPEGLTVDWLKAYVETGTKNLLIFHYGGHAGPDGLEYINIENERVTLLYSELALFMESFRNLKLVFINGCESEQAAAFFLKKADVLICTNKPVGDEFASKFAHTFYSNFLKINDLENAFTTTLSLVSMGGGRGTSDFQRGAMSTAVLNQVTPSVFELKLRDNNPEIGKSTFQNWKQIIQPNLTQAKETTLTTRNMGIPEHAYLRCNREDQEYFFEEGLGKKRDKQTPQPLFVFIHGLEDHCPLDLFDRFVNHTLVQEKWGLKKTPTEVDLPINPKLNALDLCKLTLLENYCHQGKFGQQNADRTWSLTQQIPDNEWIVIRHKLSYGKWQPNWGVFLDYYVNEFGKELAEKMSQKLIIVTTRTTRNEGDEFAQYFDTLANDPTKNVVNLTGFEKINQDHIRDWQEKVFGTTKFQSSEIVEGNDEKFFFEIKELLKAKLIS